MYLRATEAIIAKLKDSDVTYMVEASAETSSEAPGPVILHGAELDFRADISDVKHLGDNSQVSLAKSFPCSYFCSKSRVVSPFSVEVFKVYVKILMLFCILFGIFKF